MLARENPFAAERILNVRYRFNASSWREFREQLERQQFRGTIWGAKGSGKTTLLEDLARVLQTEGRAVHSLRFSGDHRPRLAELAHELSLVTATAVVLIDGAEQFTPWNWARLMIRLPPRCGLIITSHRRGWLQPLWHCETSLQLFDGVLQELLGDAWLRWRPRAHELFDVHDGNIRDALRGLYDDSARCAAGELEKVIHLDRDVKTSAVS